MKYSHFIGSHDDGSIYTNSTDFYPSTNADSNSWLYYSAKFTDPETYFEFGIKLLSGVTGAEVRLYNLTDSAAVAGSSQTVTTSGRYRTSEITLTSGKEYIAQSKITGGAGYVRVTRPRVAIKQIAELIKRMETYIPIACAGIKFSSLIYDALWPDGNDGTQYNGGIFTYNTSQFDGTVSVYLEAHFGSTNGRRSYVQLFDMTDDLPVSGSEISNNGTASRVRSGAFTLQDGHTYYAQTKSDGTGETATCGEIRLIIYQNTTIAQERLLNTLTFIDLRLSTKEVTVSGTSFASISILDGGSTTDEGFYHLGTDYDMHCLNAKLFAVGRKNTDTSSTHYLKVYDLESLVDLTSPITTTVFPYQSKEFVIDATETVLPTTGTHRYTVYGKKEAGSADASVSIYGLMLDVSYVTKNRSCYAQVRMILPAAAETAFADSRRHVTSRLEIRWNGIDLVDESQYLISAKGNSQTAGKNSELLSDQCDFELDNTTKKFSLENPSSDIYNYLSPNIWLRFAVGINGYYMTIFTGYITEIDPDSSSGTVAISCTDCSARILDRPAPETIYINQYYDEIIEILAQNCGLLTTDYELEGSSVMAQAAWFQDKTTNILMSEIAIAERGRVFFNASGKLSFWTKYHYLNQQPVVTLSKDNWQLNFQHTVQKENIINNVTIKSKPRKPAGVQKVWQSGDPVASNQYSTPLVWIPAKSYQNAFIELNDPAIDWQTPVAYTDFSANSAANGTGTDLTNNIVIDAFITYQQSVFISVSNTGDTDAYFVGFGDRAGEPGFCIRANPLTVYNWIKAKYNDDNSINAYGLKDKTIENDWIFSETAAQAIVEYEVTQNKEAKQGYKLSVIGHPAIRSGELVSVEVSNNNYEVFSVKQLDWNVDFGGYAQNIELANKQISFIEFESSRGIGTGVLGESIIGISTRLKTKFAQVSAKVNID